MFKPVLMTKWMVLQIKIFNGTESNKSMWSFLINRFEHFKDNTLLYDIDKWEHTYLSRNDFIFEMVCFQSHPYKADPPWLEEEG